MKEKGIVIILLIILKLILPIHPYIELNHLNIIHKIRVTCEDTYHIEYFEIIPKKEDNGMEYEYKKYEGKNNSLLKGVQEIEKSKNIYKKKAKIETIKCKNSKEIKDKIKRG